MSLWEPGQIRRGARGEPDAPTGEPDGESRYCERCDEWYPEDDLTLEAIDEYKRTGLFRMALAHTLDTGELHFVVEDPDYRPCKPNVEDIPRTSESERLGMELAEAQRRGDESRRA